MLPTLRQCREDDGRWYEEISQAGTQRDEIEAMKRIPLDGLRHRFNEMTECIGVDPDRNKDYMQMIGMFGSELYVRENNFIARHQLTETLQAEDSAGKR